DGRESVYPPQEKAAGVARPLVSTAGRSNQLMELESVTAPAPAGERPNHDAIGLGAPRRANQPGRVALGILLGIVPGKRFARAVFQAQDREELLAAQIYHIGFAPHHLHLVRLLPAVVGQVTSARHRWTTGGRTDGGRTRT